MTEQASKQLHADAPELLDVCRELLGPMIVWSQYWASTYDLGKNLRNVYLRLEIK